LGSNDQVIEDLISHHETHFLVRDEMSPDQRVSASGAILTDALERGEIDEAWRLAFQFAPVETPEAHGGMDNSTAKSGSFCRPPSATTEGRRRQAVLVV
jgi:hypothetical protein